MPNLYRDCTVSKEEMTKAELIAQIQKNWDEICVSSLFSLNSVHTGFAFAERRIINDRHG